LATHCESHVFARLADRNRFQQAVNVAFPPFPRIFSLLAGLTVCPVFGQEKRIRKFIFPFCWFSWFRGVGQRRTLKSRQTGKPT